MSISDLNELAKARVTQPSGGGGSGSQFLGGTVVADTLINRSSFSPSSYTIYSHPTYNRAFQHAPGQFSWLSATYTQNSSYTEWRAVPFLVNQTTGQITVGSGSNIFNSSVGSGITTTNYGFSGDLVQAMTYSCGPNGCNYHYNYAYRCTNNSISMTNTQYFGSNNYAVHNEECASVRNGTYLYTAFSAYYQGNSRVRRFVYGVNTGGSWSSVEDSDPGSNTSTNWTPPVAQQTIGGTTAHRHLRFWQDGSGYGRIDRMSASNLSYETNWNARDYLFNDGERASTRGSGFLLSTGDVVYQLSTGEVLLLTSAGNLSNITEAAGLIPTSDRVRAFSQVTPAQEADTWYVVTNTQTYELVKFHINPSTYKVTILGSMPLASILHSPGDLSNALNNGGGCFVTGASDQYVVLCSPQWNGMGKIVVGENTIASASL